MIPIEIWKRVGPDSSNKELRELAESTGCDLDELWTIRRRKAVAFQKCVDYQRRRYR